MTTTCVDATREKQGSHHAEEVPRFWAEQAICEWAKPESLQTREPFSSLFPLSPVTLEQITDSMKQDGYHRDQFITVWGNVVVDGHTRLAAAKAAGVKVLVCRTPFPDEATALDWAKGNQRNRRNLTDAELLRYVQEHDRRAKRGVRMNPVQPEDTPAKQGRSAERTAKAIGTATKQIERARRVLKQADELDKAEILEGKTTIHAVDQKLKGTSWEARITAQVQAMPLFGQLAPKQQEILTRDIKAYRRVEPRLQEMRELYRELASQPGPPLGRFMEKLAAFLHMPVPEQWKLCGACKCGSSVFKCERCRGRGYELF